MNEGIYDRRRLLIGDLLLDPGQRQVSRAGVTVDLPKLSFRLLHVLAVAAPNVVSQDELVARVWSGRVVSPETVTQRIRLLRQAIGDDASLPRYIGLARGEGYRMLADVQALPDDSRRPARRLLDELIRRNVLGVGLVYLAAAGGLAASVSALRDGLPGVPNWLTILCAGAVIAGFPVTLVTLWRRGMAADFRGSAAASAEGRLAMACALVLMVGATAGLGYVVYPAAPVATIRIAVMPFEIRGGDAGDEILGDGLSADLRDRLGNIEGLEVFARASSVVFRDTDLAPAEIAGRLKVGRLIIGTFERRDDALRIDVEITDSDGIRLWQRQYEAAPNGSLSVRQRLLDDISAALAPDWEKSPLDSKSPTDSEAAYSLMLVADKYYQNVLDRPEVDEELLDAAIGSYREAALADPNSAEIYSHLAAALLYAGRIQEAEAPIRLAIDLDENHPHVQHTLGLYFFLRRENGVGDHYRRAIELNPNYVEALVDYGFYLWARGDVTGAKSHLERALELDPWSLIRYEELGNFLGNSGYHDEALELAAGISERFDTAAADLIVARIYELTGDLGTAIAWAFRARGRDPELDAANWTLGQLYTRIDDPVNAQLYDPEPSASKYYFSRDYADLIDFLEDRSFENDSPLAVFLRARALAATDRSLEAARWLEDYGVRAHAQTDSITTSEMEAVVVLADVLKEAGRLEDARSIAAEWLPYFTKHARQSPGWHPDINIACLSSVLDEDADALRALENLARRRGLPSYPMLADQPCFRRKFAGNARYEAVLESVRARKMAIRENLPRTLEQFRLTESAPPASFAIRTTDSP